MSKEHRDPAATGAILCALLTENARYRRIWSARTRRARASLSQAAVAEVIALDLWERGERADDAVNLARSLKDRISRALAGSAISAETLNWFISAFQMDESDQALLWGTFGLRQPSRAGVSDTLRRRRDMIRPQRHRTVSLFERYFVGSDHGLKCRRTLHTIRAVEDGVGVYIFSYQIEATEVEVIHGGRIGRQFNYGDGLVAREFILDQRLTQGETTAMEYQTVFPPGVFPVEVRRAAYGRAENVDLAVEFEGSAPETVWWCVWDDHLDGSSVSEEEIPTPNRTAHRYIPYIQETVVGFRWRW